MSIAVDWVSEIAPSCVRVGTLYVHDLYRRVLLKRNLQLYAAFSGQIFSNQDMYMNCFGLGQFVTLILNQ